VERRPDDIRADDDVLARVLRRERVGEKLTPSEIESLLQEDRDARKVIRSVLVS